MRRRDCAAARTARDCPCCSSRDGVLDELRRVAGDLHFVDGVVAENGAVAALSPKRPDLPAGAQPCRPAFVAELRRRGIAVPGGRVPRGCERPDANDAPRLLEVVRTLELPLVLVFNRGRS